MFSSRTRSRRLRRASLSRTSSSPSGFNSMFGLPLGLPEYQLALLIEHRLGILVPAVGRSKADIDEGVRDHFFHPGNHEAPNPLGVFLEVGALGHLDQHLV